MGAPTKKEAETPPAEPETEETESDDPKAVIKGLMREVLDEWSAERATDPQRTKRPDSLRTFLGF